MANIIRSVKSIDSETGEIYYEKKWNSYNGWSENGYKYRYRYSSVKFYPDNPPKLQPNTLKIFFQICMQMNDENLLMEVKKAKNKYSSPELIPYTLEEIRENMQYQVSEYAFKKAWAEMTPKYIRRIKFKNKMVWAVNPAFANRCQYIPVFLWHEFQEDLNPKLGEMNIKKYNNMYLADGL